MNNDKKINQLPKIKKKLDLNFIKQYWKVIAVWLLIDLFFFRHNYLSGFDRVFGDLGDPRIVLVLLEHWFKWWEGTSTWNSPNFFWPIHGVLGYTDAFFLFAIPYILARVFSFDSYISMELSYHVIKLVGYLGMFWMLYIVLAIKKNWAIFGAALFSILNGLYWHSIHMQLAAIAITPWLIGLTFQWVKNGQKLTTAICLGALLASLFLTSFYMAWYTSLAIILIIFILAILKKIILQKGWLKNSSLGLFVFFICLIPFIYLYTPVLIAKGGHAFSNVLSYSLTPIEVFRVGEHNLLWGWAEELIYKQLAFIPSGDQNYIPNFERIAGFTPILFFLFFIFSIILTSKFIKEKNCRDEILIPALFSVVAITFWLLSAKYGEWSPWKYVFDFIPGGQAMRVPSRILIFCSVFVVPVVIYGLSNYLFKPKFKAVTIGLCFLILIEQINTGPMHEISRSREKSRLSIISPPNDCEAFFISEASSIKTGYSLLDEFYLPNIDAMVMASRLNLPTLNGVSTWTPNGWSLIFPGSKQYTESVKLWINRNDLSNQTVCSLNLKEKTWKKPGLENSQTKLELDANGIQFKQGSPGVNSLRQGWSYTENWGVWSSDQKATLKFHSSKSIHGIELKMQSFRAEERPLTIEASMSSSENSHVIFINRSSPEIYVIKFPNPKIGDISIQFDIKSPRSPVEWGIGDNRNIGLGLIEIKPIY